MKVILQKSIKPEKKFQVLFENGKKVYFGASGYSDFTIHKDTERRNRYIQRHQKHEDWNNIYSAGFWSKHLLWGISPNINKCIKYIENKFKIKIIKQI